MRIKNDCSDRLLVRAGMSTQEQICPSPGTDHQLLLCQLGAVQHGMLLNLPHDHSDELTGGMFTVVTVDLPSVDQGVYKRLEGSDDAADKSSVIGCRDVWKTYPLGSDGPHKTNPLLCCRPIGERRQGFRQDIGNCSVSKLVKR